MGGCCCSSRGPDLPPAQVAQVVEHGSLPPIHDTSSGADLETATREAYRALRRPLPFDVGPRTVEAEGTLGKSDAEIKTESELDSSKQTEDEPAKLDETVAIAPEAEECSICFDEYDADHPQFTTNCGHHYHLSCILEWRKRGENCPICNQILVINQSSSSS